MAKLHATEAAQRMIDAAVQLHGALGVTWGHPVERLYREIRALRIYEGASRGPAADHRPGAAAVTDTFAPDRLPPREAWPDLLLLDGPSRVNAAVELLRHEGTAIAGGWSYAELRERAAAVASALRDRAGHARAAALAQHRRGDRGVARDPAGRRDRRGDDAAAAGGRDREGGGEGAPGGRRSRRATLAGEVARASARLRRAQPAPARASSRSRTCRRAAAFDARRHGRRRRRDHRVHLRHDRDAEGLRALPSRPARELRHVRAPRPRRRSASDVFSGTPPLAFTFGLGGLVLFPLRFGARRRRSPSPADMLEAIARARDHDAVHRADRVPRAARARTSRARLHTCVSRRRAAPGGRVGRLVREDRHPDRRRDRLDRDAAHLHRLARRPRRGPARAGGRSPATRRGSSTTTCGRSRRARSASSRCAGRPAAATSTTRARRRTCATAGTSPATRSRWTPTATSGSRRAPTT